MTIKLTAFRWVPDFAKGLVKDIRVRWALEEAGLPYESRLIGREAKADPAYRALQPFGQVPVYEEDGLTLFESGAIVLHIAGRSPALAPADPGERARMTVWLFAALNSVEPTVQQLSGIDLFHADAAWAKERRPMVVEMVRDRLAPLESRLADREFLEGHFTAGDLMMCTVLRDLRQTDLLSQFPALEAYKARCEARPAFRKALADQMAVFAEHAPAIAAE
jgi:glutathione S-transferase